MKFTLYWALSLSFEALAVAKDDVVTVTVTTHLPLDQHPCMALFVLEPGSPLPEGACNPGACCLEASGGGLAVYEVIEGHTVTLHPKPETTGDKEDCSTTWHTHTDAGTVTSTTTPADTTTASNITLSKSSTSSIPDTSTASSTTTISTSISSETSTSTSSEPDTTDFFPPDPTTTTATSTTLSNCPKPTCQAGVEEAYYFNPFNDDTSSNYDSFSPEYFKKTLPLETTVSDKPIYVSTPRGNTRYDNAAIGYRAFLYACQNGTYKFTSPYSDDITIAWFGDKAYKGWTRDNADIIQFYYGDNSAWNIYRNITAGEYYPIRVLWGNTGGAGDLELRIFAPDGQEMSGGNVIEGSYLTTDACDGSYGPWPPWGNEE